MKKLVNVLGGPLSFNSILSHLGGAGQTLSHIIIELNIAHIHSVSSISPPARFHVREDTGGTQRKAQRITGTRRCFV
jgi:hypothetical protein